MENKQIIEETVERFSKNFQNVRAASDDERRAILSRYSAAIQPNFTQWLAISISAVRSDDSKEILRKNLYDEVTQDHPGMLKRFCDSARVAVSPDDVERSTKDLYYIVGDVFNRGYATSVRKVAALAVMENASLVFIPTLRSYASNLGANDLEYADVHGIADKEHSDELMRALDSEVEAQVAVGHDVEFCNSAARIGAHISAEFLVNVLSPDRNRYISL